MAEVRPATADDIPALLALGEAMHAESRYADLPWHTPKVCGLMDWMIANDDGCLLVAEQGGEIVGGFMGMAAEHFFSTSKMATDLALFVPTTRRGGLAAVQLMRAYVTWAQERGIPNPQAGITTGVDVDRSSRLYESLGFKPVGNLFEYQGNPHVHRR